MFIFPSQCPPVCFGCDILDKILGHCNLNDINMVFLALSSFFYDPKLEFPKCFFI